MIIGTAGHIDHGKTSLVRALTGVDTDRLKEEQRRGITIELGFAYLPRPSGDIIGFVDVPGHERLVHTMLAGASGMSLFVYVVVNGGMITGVLPVVGVPLPLMSYGGTSAVSMLTGFGVLMSMNAASMPGSTFSTLPM